MMTIGSPVDQTGMLVRDGGAFVLHADDGGRFQLQLPRVPIDHVAKRVRVIGVMVAVDVISVDGVSSA